MQHPLPRSQSATLAAQSPAFDDVGTRLWNASIGLLDSEAHSVVEGQNLAGHVQHAALVRVFALQLLEISSRLQRSSGVRHDIRIMKTAVKTAQSCLESNCLDLASKALELCSEHIEEFEKRDPLIQICNENKDIAEHEQLRAALVTQYVLLRVFHAFKTHRLDLADHFFKKLNWEQQSLSPRLREQAADLFYEIARSLAKDQKQDVAIPWFERAVTSLSACTPESTSIEVAELSISVMISFGLTALAALIASRANRT